MKYSNKIYLFLFLGLLLGMVGCKSKRMSSAGPLIEKEHKQIVEDVLKNDIQYKTLQTKGSIEFRSGSSSYPKLGTTYTIIKDEAMQASVRMPIIGTEAARLIFTTDSIIIIDRMKKRYFAESLKNIKDKVQIDYNNLQALMTNGLFIPGQKTIAANDYKHFEIKATQDVYMLRTAAKDKVLYNFAVDASDHIISTLISSPSNEMAVQWSYNDFVDDNGKVYPREMEAQLEFKEFKATAIISYSKLDFDKEVTIDRTISPKYRRMSFQELLSMFKMLK